MCLLISLDKKVFMAVSNSTNGEVGEKTRFYYEQDGNIISADYMGGDIVKGHLIGKQLESGSFDFVYHHINSSGELKVGKCLSKASLHENGKIKLSETWKWLSDDMSSGESELIEVD